MSTPRRRPPSPAPPQHLRDLANVGPATLADFRVLGISSVAQLRRRDPFKLFDSLCRKTAQRHDPCCIDVFMAAIDEARTGRPTPWWKFTPKRKAMLAARARTT